MLSLPFTIVQHSAAKRAIVSRLLPVCPAGVEALPWMLRGRQCRECLASSQGLTKLVGEWKSWLTHDLWTSSNSCLSFFRHCCCDMLWLSFQFLQVLRWLLRCHILLGLRWCFVPLTVLLLSGSVLVACCRAAICRDLAGHIPTFKRKIPWKIIHEGIHWSDYSLEHPAPSHPSIQSEFPWIFLWKISIFWFRTSRPVGRPLCCLELGPAVGIWLGSRIHEGEKMAGFTVSPSTIGIFWGIQ